MESKWSIHVAVLFNLDFKFDDSDYDDDEWFLLISIGLRLTNHVALLFYQLHVTLSTLIRCFPSDLQMCSLSCCYQIVQRRRCDWLKLKDIIVRSLLRVNFIIMKVYSTPVAQNNTAVWRVWGVARDPTKYDIRIYICQIFLPFLKPFCFPCLIHFKIVMEV